MLHLFQDVTPAQFLDARSHVAQTRDLSHLDELSLYRILKAGGRLRLSYDHKMGYILTHQGDLQSVFNVGIKGMGAKAIQDAIQCGAVTLDAFDGKLVRYYKRFGFKELYRVKFNPALAPMGVDFTTQPDVVYMGLDNLVDMTRRKEHGIPSQI